ncbi:MULTISPECIES: OsmC family protein [Chryseobacterium]|uniref:OsmC family protein n=1 Tax=Chryseobacterium TaxID=59732 RepID=UPI0006786797|nr:MULTISPECIES: OsmC family protein [Chryseobacterium]
MKTHHYKTTIQWTGNKGKGTSGYRDYERSHSISVENKTTIEGSSDPAFRGDKTKYNPEEMFLSSLSSCHMLWYLHFCSEAGVIVTEYMDEATGIMAETADGSGHFTEVTLHPVVTVTEESMMEQAKQLHHKANQFCFIANSVNFSIKHMPTIKMGTSISSILRREKR